MKEYIERETLKGLLERYGATDDALALIDTISAADVAPVRHGRWVKQPSEIPGLDVEFCSECKQGMNKRNQFWDAKYCPACGALMDGKEDGQ